MNIYFFRKLLTVTTLFLAFSFSLSAQYAVESVRHIPSKPLSKGIFYSLPQNGIKVKIIVEKTVFRKGIYGDYAANLLGIDNYIKEEKILYKIKNIHISNTSYPDPDQVFYLFVKGGSIPSLNLSQNGILRGVNEPGNLSNCNNSKIDKNKTNENKFSEYQSQKKYSENRSSIGSLGVKAPFADLNIYQKYDTSYKEEFTDSGSTILRQVLTPVMESKSLEQRANEIANLIIESKKNRTDLLSGLQEVNYAPETIKFMYERLLQTENEYMESFTGVISTSDQSYEFEIMIDTALSYPIAFFHTEEGLYEMNEADRAEADINDTETIFLHLKKLPYCGAIAASFEQSNVDPSSLKGIHYRIPQQVEAEIRSGETIFKSKRLFVAQWGETLSLPVLKNTMIKLNSTTGALIYVGDPYSYNPYPRH